MHTPYWLTNVLIENGFLQKAGVVCGTKTETVHLRIENGKIAQIVSGDTILADNAERKDAKGRLALPSFREAHCHLDKTLLGGGWRASKPFRSIWQSIETETEQLASWSVPTAERARNMLAIMQQAGSTHVRTHVDLYPEVGLANLEAVRDVLADYQDMLTYEIVAFPQRGLLRSQSVGLMREALRNGATLVGGVDPATIDGDTEASLHAMMELAVEADAGIDLHLHDADQLGIYTIKRLAAMTIEAGWQGRVTVSHAYCLGEIAVEEAADAGDMLAAAGISIITSVPIDSQMPPVKLLTEKGVRVAVGSDNIYDSWSPFGNGDMLERASRLAERFRWIDEHSLSRALAYITGGKTPLSDDGKQQWPLEGDDASLVLVEASCSAEAVARVADRTAVLHKGKLVAGE
ncbi:deaminase [Brevibacillus fluminis]|uniref:Deaminase n=1 Tax=Brevibacillus fluminis TaxID=511487 RepID=A0A3M8DT94_9BACL|nr:amidohydrolase [Brevibacillus fluminis]RNB90685.1 deaminase [Brevibacillus fluminis]